MDPIWWIHSLFSFYYFTIYRVVPARDCHYQCAHRFRNGKRDTPLRVIAMKVFVGWGHVPTGAGTTNCVQACLCQLSAAYADGGDMSPPYRGCFVYHGAFSPVDCEERSDTAISCRNYRLRTTLFAPTVCRCADGTPRSSCPTNFDRTLAVGRDDSARRCRNHQMRTNSFVCTVCRFAVFGDISPPYIGCFVYQCMFSPVDCEERSDVAISALSKTTHSPKCVD